MNNNSLLDNICIAHLNARSVFTGFNEISNLAIDNSFTIFAVSETWLSEAVPSEAVMIPGYNLFRQDRTGRGGGVALYVKSTLQAENLSIDIVNNEGLEFLWLKIKINRMNVAIGVFYRPPRINLLNCTRAIDDMLPRLIPMYDEVVILGDFNVNLLEVQNPLSQCFESFGFSQVINEPTRISRQAMTLLDPIYLSNSDLLCQAGTINADCISDHKLVYCKLKLPIIRHNQKFVTFRDFKSFNSDIFNYELRNIHWDNLYYINDIDCKVEFLTNNIICLFQNHAPFKTVRVNKPPAPWLTHGLKLIFKERDKALALYKRDKSDRNWNAYKELRNYALASLRREKAAYLNFLHGQKNHKELWRGLRYLNIRFNNNTVLPSTLQDPHDINDYFVSVFSKTADCNDKITYYQSNKHPDNSDFHFILIENNDVVTAINSLRSNASGVDTISLQMVKLCLPVIISHLTHIINCCLEVGYFPKKWREALVCPLPKITNPSKLNDLRPISLLPVLSKILEKIVYKQLAKYFTENNLLPIHQSGFRAGHSTTTALLNLTDNIIRHSDKHMATVLVSLDYSKAFDTIDHDLMCAKLNYFGFDLTSIKFFQSYLHQRHQKVVVSNKMSSAALIISGVPQGSILGPLLFIIYTSDVFKNVQYSQLQSYADDTQLLYHFNPNDTDIVNREINHDLKAILNFSTDHNLKLNPEKSVMLLFSSDNKREIIKNNLRLVMNNTPLVFSNRSKILGVIIDEKLRFSEHVSTLLQKSFVKLKILYANKSLINYKLRKKLTETLIAPIFNYCNVVYYPCLDAFTKNRIQGVQNACCRLVCGLRKFDHISDSFRDLKWLNVDSTVRYHFLTFIHRLLLTSVPVYLKDKLISRQSVHLLNIRFRDKLTMPHHYTALFRRSFTYNAVKLYNAYSSTINFVNASLIKFRKCVKDKMLCDQS